MLSRTVVQMLVVADAIWRLYESGMRPAVSSPIFVVSVVVSSVGEEGSFGEVGDVCAGFLHAVEFGEGGVGFGYACSLRVEEQLAGFVIF